MFALLLCVPGVARAQSAPEGNSSQSEPATNATKTIVNQKVSGTLYTNGATGFTLTVPEGWQANDNLVEPRLGVGALTSPDGEANLIIQLVLTPDDTKTAVKKIVNGLPSQFPEFRKISEAKIPVAGKDREVLTFAYVQHRTVTGVQVKMPTVARMVLVPMEYGFLLFDFVTLESIFDKELSTFDKIMSSYHSTASAGAAAKPE